jgi:colanic acid/amylovoran biosynthesis glycosyltransferase
MSSGETAEIGYVLRKFPVLSETFVLNELLALEERGVPLHVFSIHRPNDPRFHEELPGLKARVTYLPDLAEAGRLLRHARATRQHLGSRFWGTLGWVLSLRRPELLWRLLQGAYVANEARRLGLRHLHAQFANRPATVALLASRLTGIPFSFTAHATDIFKTTVNQRALRDKVEAARWVVTVSDFNRDYLLGVTDASPEKIVVVRNGIRLDQFTPGPPPAAPPFRMVCVARLVEKKGLPDLIEACAILRDRGLDFQLGIVGKGNLRQELESLIDCRKLRDHVQLLGPHTHGEVLLRYREAHLCVLSAVVGRDGNQEGLPVSIVEALACGLPVVSTPIAGIPEAVRNGHNGLLVPPGDPAALASALERVMREPGLYARLQMNARPSVVDNFDLPQTAAALHRILQGRSPATEAAEAKPGTDDGHGGPASDPLATGAMVRAREMA